MPAGMDNAFAFVVSAPGDRSKDVLFEDGDFVGHCFRNPGIPVSRYPEAGFHFGEEPWGTKGGTTDHDGIDTVLFETFFSAFRGGDISVSDDGDVDSGTVFDFPDKGPIGIAAIHLRTGATVDSKFPDSAVLEGFSKGNNKILRHPGISNSRYPEGINARRQVFIIPSETRLGGDGGMNGVDDSACDIEHFRDIAKESGASTFSSHFLDRTAEIDIDEIGLGGLDDPCGLRHRFGITAVDLNGYGSFGIMDGEFARRGGDVTHECVGIDELCVNTIGTETLAEHSEGRIGDILHGSEI